MIRIKVDHVKVLNQILNHGILATMRNYPYKKGWKIKLYHKGEFIGYGEILDVVEATLENIEKYHHISGFNSPGEWLKEAKLLHGKKPKYIVIVKFLKPPFRQISDPTSLGQPQSSLFRDVYGTPYFRGERTRGSSI